MKIFDSFYRHNLACQDKLEKLRSLLATSFGIDDFWHITLYENGQLANVSTNYEQWGHFWDDEHYKSLQFLIAPSKLRDSCFQLSFDKEFVAVTDSFKDIFPQYHPFIIIQKESDTVAHVFGFAARNIAPHLESFYLNNRAVLLSFIKHYLSSSATFTNHKDEQMIDIAALRGRDCFYNRAYGNNALVDQQRHAGFFTAIGVEEILFSQAKTLSPREKAVLLGVYEGKTAKEHGKELDLSPRTIQFYLDNAKNKLGILSRDELFESIHILKMAGYL